MKKVTAKHLMIGDWVKHEKRIMKVKELSILASKYRIYYEDSIIGSSTATPIPITEDWWKLNGFDADCIYFVKIINKNTVISINIEGHLCIYFHKTPTFLYGIKYIHQLQQAYRLATGKELKIKF